MIEERFLKVHQREQFAVGGGIALADDLSDVSYARLFLDIIKGYTVEHLREALHHLKNSSKGVGLTHDVVCELEILHRHSNFLTHKLTYK